MFVSVGVAGLADGGIHSDPAVGDRHRPAGLPLHRVHHAGAVRHRASSPQVLRGKVGQAEESEDLDVTAKTDWVALAKLVGFVVLHIFLIEPAGWPVAAAVLFSGAAWSLEAKPLWKAIVVSVILALVLQYVFGGLLGVSLPPGPLLEGVPFFHG